MVGRHYNARNCIKGAIVLHYPMQILYHSVSCPNLMVAGRPTILRAASPQLCSFVESFLSAFT